MADPITDEILDFELVATSLLLHEWVKEFGRDERRARIRSKMADLRKAVLRPYSGRKRELVPHELVRDEFDLVRHAVRSFRKDPTRDVIPYPLSEDRSILRPWPWPGMRRQHMLKATGTPTEAARRIVGERLRLGSETVRKAVRRKYRRPHPLPGQQLLASLFLDYCREMPAADARPRLGDILDVLVGSGYPLIKVYYLVRAAHSPRPASGVSPCPEAFFKELRGFMVQGKKVPASFSRLL